MEIIQKQSTEPSSPPFLPDLDRLQAINNRLADLASHNDVKTFFKIHNDFHDLFIKAADNEKLRELITSVVNRFQRLRLMSLSLPERMTISVQEHEKIIEAFRRRDAATAEALVRLNAEYGGRVLVDGHAPATPSAQAGEAQISPQLVGQGWLH